MLSKLTSFLLLTIFTLLFFSCNRILLNAVANKYNKHNGKEFPILVLEDINGNKINTADFRGKTVLLNTWGTWCPPCLNEIPGLNYINKKLSDKTDFILVNICARSDKAQWKKVVADKQLDGVNLYLPDSLFKKYDVIGFDKEGWPYNIILGKDGKVLGGSIEVDAEGENLMAIYNILKAMKNVDAKSSAKDLFTLVRKMKNIDEPEMKEFKDFFGKYADTTRVKASGTFFQ